MRSTVTRITVRGGAQGQRDGGNTSLPMVHRWRHQARHSALGAWTVGSGPVPAQWRRALGDAARCRQRLPHGGREKGSIPAR
jgi:hypothetical protein